MLRGQVWILRQVVFVVSDAEPDDHIRVQSEQVLLLLSLSHALLLFFEFESFLNLLDCHSIREKTDEENWDDTAKYLDDVELP